MTRTHPLENASPDTAHSSKRYRPANVAEIPEIPLLNPLFVLWGGSPRAALERARKQATLGGSTPEDQRPSKTSHACRGRRVPPVLRSPAPAAADRRGRGGRARAAPRRGGGGVSARRAVRTTRRARRRGGGVASDAEERTRGLGAVSRRDERTRGLGAVSRRDSLFSPSKATTPAARRLRSLFRGRRTRARNRKVGGGFDARRRRPGRRRRRRHGRASARPRARSCDRLVVRGARFSSQTRTRGARVVSAQVGGAPCVSVDAVRAALDASERAVTLTVARTSSLRRPPGPSEAVLAAAAARPTDSTKKADAAARRDEAAAARVSRAPRGGPVIPALRRTLNRRRRRVERRGAPAGRSGLASGRGAKTTPRRTDPPHPSSSRPD